jgi:hypothetical protein
VAVAALVAGLGACTQPPAPTTPTCAAPTAITVGYPPATISGPVPGWFTLDTRTNGSVRVDATYGAPSGYGCNAAVLTTGDTDGGLDKAQLGSFDQANTTFASVHDVSYWAYRSSQSDPGTFGDLAFDVALTDLTTVVTLSYEPYQQSGGAGAIQNDKWQKWNASAGVWWTTAITSGPGSQDDPQPWTYFQSLYGSTFKVAAYGFNIGSYNPHLFVAGDGITFGSKTTDF